MNEWTAGNRFTIFDPSFRIHLVTKPYLKLVDKNSTESFMHFFWSWPLKDQHTNSLESWKAPLQTTKCVSSRLSFQAKTVGTALSIAMTIWHDMLSIVR